MEKITEEAALSVVEWIGSCVGRAAAVGSADRIAIARWLLVAPAAVSGFYAALYLAGMFFCLETEWAFLAGVATVMLGAPVLVVLFGTAMAPERRRAAAWIVYSGGLAAAARMTEGMLELLIPVALAGACAAWAGPQLWEYMEKR